MLIVMRVPHGAIKQEASQWWIDQTMNLDRDVHKELKMLDSARKQSPTREFNGN